MSMIIGLGSNLGDKKKNLATARSYLELFFCPIQEQSSLYRSEPVDYLEQDEFINQVVQMENPHLSPENILSILKNIESKMESYKHTPKGPRIIDLDLIFLGTTHYSSPTITIPHRAWKNRSFVVLPLLEVSYAQTLKQHFTFPESFCSKSSKIV